MRLLANENIPGPTVEFLKNAGHDVFWLRRDAPGISDDEAMTLAEKEGRTLLTLDKDFAALAFRSKRPAPYGIILVRCFPAVPAKITALLKTFLSREENCEGQFVTIEEQKIRRRSLP